MTNERRKTGERGGGCRQGMRAKGVRERRRDGEIDEEKQSARESERGRERKRQRETDIESERWRAEGEAGGRVGEMDLGGKD